MVEFIHLDSQGGFFRKPSPEQTKKYFFGKNSQSDQPTPDSQSFRFFHKQTSSNQAAQNDSSQQTNGQKPAGHRFFAQKNETGQNRDQESNKRGQAPDSSDDPSKRHSQDNSNTERNDQNNSDRYISQGDYNPPSGQSLFNRKPSLNPIQLPKTIIFPPSNQNNSANPPTKPSDSEENKPTEIHIDISMPNREEIEEGVKTPKKHSFSNGKNTDHNAAIPPDSAIVKSCN